MTLNAEQKKAQTASGKAITSKVKLIVTSGDKLNKLIHETGMMVLRHAVDFSDCGYAKDIYNAMPASFRRQKFLDWLEVFSPIRYNLSTDKVGMLKATAKGYMPFDLEGADAKPFYEMAKEDPEKPPFDLKEMLKLITGLVKRAEKSIDEGKAATDDIPMIQEIARKMGAIKLDVPVASNDTPKQEAPKEAPKTALAEAMAEAARKAA